MKATGKQSNNHEAKKPQPSNVSDIPVHYTDEMKNSAYVIITQPAIKFTYEIHITYSEVKKSTREELDGDLNRVVIGRILYVYIADYNNNVRNYPRFLQVINLKNQMLNDGQILMMYHIYQFVENMFDYAKSNGIEDKVIEMIRKINTNFPIVAVFAERNTCRIYHQCSSKSPMMIMFLEHVITAFQQGKSVEISVLLHGFIFKPEKGRIRRAGPKILEEISYSNLK